MATFLDPRYKELPFLGPFSKRKIVNMMEELITLESNSMDQRTKKLSRERI